ncbi:PLAT domain-containing protein 3-like [Neltuma alba]|uniref:PLAT domain-containing protein 3-like n=1 Tax=Neltuma alba TaxID=207710 RepID=UPI0010A2C7B0|nr:PLAT domain-containing protein 3-like [Prosopis alba]XP_028790921.1 PLAT domain-containing protein 3-like [Prosopis alba]
MAKSQDRCLYTIKVKTSWDDGSGTNSVVKLQIFDSTGKNFVIGNLEQWGIMEPHHEYFERDNLDFFSGGNICLNPCSIFLSIDGQGNRPEWHVEYVEITVTGPTLNTRIGFPVNNWLGAGFPTTVNLCLPLAKEQARSVARKIRA